MTRYPLMAMAAAATLTLLMTSALAASAAQDSTYEMPEVVVSGKVEERRHPQDGNYSEPPLGCVEVVTPSGGGNEMGGYFQARFGRSSVSVMPSLNDPSSSNDTRPDQTGKEYQPIPPGTMSSTPQCPW